MLDSSYEDDVRGKTPPAYVVMLMQCTGSLLARAAIREELARQDDAIGDTWAAVRNRAVAADMRRRALLRDLP